MTLHLKLLCRKAPIPHSHIKEGKKHIAPQSQNFGILSIRHKQKFRI